MRDTFTQGAYLLAGGLFVLALKWLSAPATARRGVLTGELGMLLAIVGTLVRTEIVSYEWILVGLLVGSAIGVPMAALVPMTAMPQRTALSHAFGALASALVGASEFYLTSPRIERLTMGVLAVEVLLGCLTFTGSLMAFAKLQGLIAGRPITYRAQNQANLLLLAVAAVAGVWLVVDPGVGALFAVLVVLSLVFGVLLILPIGGADMPTVISLLNSYAGLSGAATGFVLDNKVLIIAGALDGSSGFLLSLIMSRAMNRNFRSILFGAFGQVQATAAAAAERPVRHAGAEEAAMILENARRVIIVPGYGMAVSQAQHKVAELSDLLTRRGIDVKFAIHPVAGRMPGHMNVLLAEADVPYDQLLEMDEINADFAQTDVALVVGANDVTNPAARHATGSPIYGMPILNVDRAQSVMVVKRSLAPGFAGIENELYHDEKTTMLFGDARTVIGKLVNELSSSGGGEAAA